MSEVIELFQRPRIMLKILYFSEDHQFFQNSQEIKFFMAGVENVFIN